MPMPSVTIASDTARLTLHLLDELFGGAGVGEVAVR
jgi:hypothetical protein